MVSADTKSVIERAKRIYSEQLRKALEPQHMNRFVAIEPESGEYFLGDTFDEVVKHASADIQEVFRSDVLLGAPNFVSEAAYTAARDIHLPALRSLYQGYFARTGVAAIVFPATLVPATPIGEDVTVDIRGRKVPFATAVARNIAPGSTAGVPGLVLPAGLTAAGLPVAIEFDAPAGADRALLALGLSLERALGPLPPPNV